MSAAAVLSAAGSIAGAAGGLFGSFGWRSKQQHQKEQQRELNEQAALLNYTYGEKAAENAFARQLQMYEMSKKDESYESQIEDMKKAGLSVGLAASGGAGSMGGMGQASTAPQGSGASGQQGGRAANAAEIQMAQQNSLAMGVQIAKLASEIDVNKSIAKKNEADAGLSGEKALTESESRSAFIEQITQEGKSRWLENIGKQIKFGDIDTNEGYTLLNNEQYGSVGISPKAFFTEREAAEIAETWARSNNNEALAELNSKYAEGYWKELMNATIHANADAMKAAAVKLCAEWNTGEYTNWKTWTDIAGQVVDDVIGAIGMVRSTRPQPKIKNKSTYQDTQKHPGGNSQTVKKEYYGY